MGHVRLSTRNPSNDYPAFLKKVKSADNSKSTDKPILIRMEENSSSKELETLLKDHPVSGIIDNYDEQYAELLLSKNAHLYRANHDVQVASISKLLKEHYGNTEPWKLGSWVYYPWRQEIVHVLVQSDFEELRTIRNRDLITAAQQEKLLDFEVAAFGMSVGSAGAQAVSISGISRRIKLIDGNVISGSNLNRILTGVPSVGLSKALVIGRQIYEMNPYSEVAYFNKATSANLAEIFDLPWKVKLAIDEIDDIQMKVAIRLEARKRRIPVVMATELGDTIMLDVERFDEEPTRPLFHNLLPGVEEVANSNLDNYREWTKKAVSIIDPNNMPLLMQKSLLKIGTTIVTHPQLGSTVMMTGGVLAFAVKNIALNKSLKSGRYVISLENELLASHQSRDYRKRHKKHTKVIQRAINSM